MFNIRIGDTKFNIYLLLDKNEVVIKLHDIMKMLSNTNAYKTVITCVEKFTELDKNSIEETDAINVYTLIVLMSPRHLKANEIAILFKEAYKRRKNKWESFYGYKRR